MKTLVLVLSLVASACTVQHVQRSSLPCPPPPPPPSCAPGTYSGVTYDTSKTINGLQWTIRRVAGAQSPRHEWALTRPGQSYILLSGSSPATARYTATQRVSVSTIEPLLNTPPEEVYSTSVLENRTTGDASVVVAKNRNGVFVPEAEVLDSISIPVHWDGHPAISPDGSLLVFASDRPEGIGGTDLWYSYRIGQRWSAPQSIGDAVNTPCDELCPQFAGDSVIVFASAGHNTVGGYDLFSARIKERTKTTLQLGKPQNLGAPVNTTYDELFPFWADETTLYYSSDQPLPSGSTRKDFDVFVLTSRRITTGTPAADGPEKEREPEQPPLLSSESTVVVTGTVVRDDNQKPISGADVTATDPERNQVVSKTTTDTAGLYRLNVPTGRTLDVTAQAPDLFFDKVRIVTPREPSDTSVPIHVPLTVPVTFVLRVNFPTAVFDRPYEFTLDSNGMDTDLSWMAALDELAENVKKSGSMLKRLVLIGHTDDVDTDANNLILGKNRVQFIMDELVKRGVERTLLDGRSAGESLLPARKPGESIVLWRKRARRVELVKVLHQ